MTRQEYVPSGMWLFSRALRYPFLLLFVLAAAAAGAYAFCAFVSAAGDFLEAARLPGGVQAASGRFAFLAAVFAALLSASFLAGNGAGTSLAIRVERDCLLHYCAGLLTQDNAFHLRRRSAELLPEAGGETLGRMFVPGLLGMFRAVFACLVLLLMTARIHLLLLPFPALFILFLFRSLAGFDWKCSAAALEEEERKEKLCALAEEAAAGRETILTQALTAETAARFYTESVFLRDARAQKKKTVAAFFPGLYFWPFWGAALLLGFFLVTRGMISPGGFAAYAGFFAVFLYASRVCPSAWGALRQGGRTARRMLKLITEKSPESPAPETGKAAGKNTGEEDTPPGSVSFHNVFFSYAQAVVLRRINFSVEPGMFVVIAGAAGSGKTTLARLVGRVLAPRMGSVHFGGDYGEQRKSVAFIGEEPFLLPLTLRENIALGNPSCSEAQLREAAEKAGVHDFITALPEGYETRAAALTPDQAFCIALARAILSDPRVLVIDDAVPFGDSAAEERLHRAIHQAAQG
ncbi:MAG: ABC transporter ATP-binding protein/permease, partial [Spirochaetaceae bacterium]|nr:ABC transporter ATP-binding protein/permease [Spirochaetaceae bacterium]